MASAALPHAYPFRFVDAVSLAAQGTPGDTSWHGRVEAQISTNAWAARDGQPLTPSLLAEAIAQAALLLEGGDPQIGKSGFLAGIEAFEVARLPRAGESISISVRLAARFGPVFKFEGEVESAGEAIARGAILIRKGNA